MDTSRLALSTRCIPAGLSPEPATGAVVPPTSLATTYVQESPGVHAGFSYSRAHNSTRFAWERSICALESACQAWVFASGMAAIATVLDLLESGSHVVASKDLYADSTRLFTDARMPSAALAFSYVDLSDLSQLEAALRPDARLIWVETPSKPMLRLSDLSAIVANRRGVVTVADNTFATPILQRPLELGFDLVAQSSTKHPNGHSFEHRGRRCIAIQHQRRSSCV